MGFAVYFYQFSILRAEECILLDGVVEHFLGFLQHLAHGGDPRWHGRLRLAQVVTQNITQVVDQTITVVVIYVGSVFFVVMITHLIHFILQKGGGPSGENGGYSVERRL